MARQTPVISDFTLGLNDSLDPDRLKDNELQGVLNMHPNLTGNVTSRGGQTTVVTASTTAQGHVTGFFEAESSTGGVYAIKAVNATAAQLFYKLTDANVSSVISKGSGVTGPLGVKWRFVFFQDRFIGVAPGWPVIDWYVATGSVTANILGGTPVTGGAGVTAPIDIAIWNSRVCLAQGVEVYISDASEAEDWLSGDAQVLRFRGATFGEEDITAIYPFGGDLIVFKESSIWQVSPGNGLSSSWEIKQIGSGVGCDARLSIVDIGRDLVWLSGPGFNSLADIRDRGGKAVDGRISQKINRTIISQMNSTSLGNAVGIYNPDLEEYMCSIPGTSGTTSNTKVVVLSTRWTAVNEAPSWWPYAYTTNLTAFCRRKSAGLDVIQAGGTNGAVYELNDTSTNSDDGTVFEKYMETKRYSFGNFTDNKVFRKISVDITQEQSFDIDVYIKINDESRTKSYTTDIVGSGAEWDSAYWDVDDWVDVFKGADRRDIQYVGRNIQVKLSNDSDNQSMAINKILIEYEPITEDLAL